MDNLRWLKKGYEPPRASTKLLRGFAISLSQKFAISYEYLMPTMRQKGCDCFRLDLLTSELQPACCEEPRNRTLAEKIVGNWALLQMRFPHVIFVSAELVSFWDEPDASGSPWIETCITFRADDGRIWSGGIREPWPPGSMQQWRTLDS